MNGAVFHLVENNALDKKKRSCKLPPNQPKPEVVSDEVYSQKIIKMNGDTFQLVENNAVSKKQKQSKLPSMYYYDDSGMQSAATVQQYKWFLERLVSLPVGNVL